jgi:hypothetical protein
MNVQKNKAKRQPSQPARGNNFFMRVMLACMVFMVQTIAVVGAEPATDASIATAEAAAPATWYCTDDYARRIVIDLDVSNKEIQVRTTPEDLFETTCTIISPKQVEIRVRALKPGHGTLEIINSPALGLEKENGVPSRNHDAASVLYFAYLQVLKIQTNASKSINQVGNLPDGSDIFEGELVLTPYVPGIDVRFICLKPRNTVIDGMGERWVASETFTPVLATGHALTSFRMVRPKGEKWVPYSYILYHQGEQISAP